MQLRKKLNGNSFFRMMEQFFTLLILSAFFTKLSIAQKYQVISENRCELKIVGDYEFYKTIGDGNYATAARYLINLVERLNEQIFGPVDWGWDINGRRLVGIGFAIKELKVLNRTTSDEPDHYASHIGSGVVVDDEDISEALDEDGGPNTAGGFTKKQTKTVEKDHHSTHTAKHSPKKDALRMKKNAVQSAPPTSVFNPYKVLETFSREEGTNATCLTLLISAKVFASGILGISNIGRSGERGICAVRMNENGVFMNTAVATVRRETGLLITREVDLLVAHEIGHSLGSIHDDEELYRDTDTGAECFPPQNARGGRYLMNGAPNSGYERNNYNFSVCSVRAVQKTLYQLASRCFVRETSSFCGNGILEPEAGEECDEGSVIVAEVSGDQNPPNRCCSTSCRLLPGALCSPRNSECCTAQCRLAGRGTMCQTRNSDVCRGAAFCDGRTPTCPQARPLPDWTQCEDEGRCRAGECRPFCESQGDPDLAPCLCDDVEGNTETLCHRCCRSLQTGLCTPLKPARSLPEGSVCMLGNCRKNVCEKKVTDATALWSRIIQNIKETPKTKVFADYFVFLVVAMTLLLWCPCGALIVYNDRQKELELMKKRMQRQAPLATTDHSAFGNGTSAVVPTIDLCNGVAYRCRTRHPQPHSADA